MPDDRLISRAGSFGPERLTLGRGGWNTQRKYNDVKRHVHETTRSIVHKFVKCPFPSSSLQRLKKEEMKKLQKN